VRAREFATVSTILPWKCETGWWWWRQWRWAGGLLYCCVSTVCSACAHLSLKSLKHAWRMVRCMSDGDVARGFVLVVIGRQSGGWLMDRWCVEVKDAAGVWCGFLTCLQDDLNSIHWWWAAALNYSLSAENCKLLCMSESALCSISSVAECAVAVLNVKCMVAHINQWVGESIRLRCHSCALHRTRIIWLSASTSLICLLVVAPLRVRC